MTTEQWTQTLLNVASAIILLTGAYFAIVKFIRPAWKRFKGLMTSFEQFIEDWSGTEARPGRDRVPGVMERLNRIDGELKNNGGSSIKDSVDRIETKILEIEERLIDGDKKFNDIQKILNK